MSKKGFFRLLFLPIALVSIIVLLISLIVLTIEIAKCAFYFCTLTSISNDELLKMIASCSVFAVSFSLLVLYGKLFKDDK